mmetsp:Transcript_25504/g.61440  ORF Transcript_25504/g.61440 Transcript_25504/m.61440 type:complete len:132 (-) Transcript_25504:151-546(-)|eukprot:CAMPEP_0114494134 /NCGR_PEP_ID=MMETSP0109-20121206/4486_1 /TAXON_ID=29199 /ORGANISM="Chlorarachnion reptans, Strain CCCM449" /LENGTH=131 /DNA_ID=CAMNT_0001671143 /DNA_START=357 /DNA_END=752 /DNA_ORIENTATION=+
MNPAVAPAPANELITFLNASTTPPTSRDVVDFSVPPVEAASLVVAETRFDVTLPRLALETAEAEPIAAEEAEAAKPVSKLDAEIFSRRRALVRTLAVLDWTEEGVSKLEATHRDGDAGGLAVLKVLGLGPL